MPFELDLYCKELDKNSGILRALLGSLSEKELSHQPVSGWNIVQVLEHILVTERVVLMMLGRPTANKGTSLSVFGDDYLQNFLNDRVNRKFKAPDGLEPKGKIKDTAHFLSSISEQREKLRNNLISGNLLVDERLYKHLILGEMSVSDWLYFIIRHCERHLAQIQEIRTKIS